MTTLSKIFLYIQTTFKLGISNVAYIAWYRFTLKSGFRRCFFPKRNISIIGDVFSPCRAHSNYPSQWKNILLTDADKIKSGNIRYYAYHWKNIGSPPNWYLNPFNNNIYPNNQQHWTQLPDFLPEVGDIKNIWEASRFEWVSTLSRAHAVTGEIKYLDTLNHWIKDWTEKNPLNVGPNWKCGQEASIRVFNLINSALILDQVERPSKTLCDIVYAHLERISTNILYAIAQDNNHGMSEASALFIGGHWLNVISDSYPQASHFAHKGRKWLENRINKLVNDDGSFSQHSTTYHRVLLDTLIFAELWRQKLELSAFSHDFYLKANVAINWLWILIDEDSGNCPNLGSNDGALFLNMHSCDYRDFRPSLQTALALFSNKKYFDSGKWDEPLYWFGKLNENIIKDTNKKSSTILFGGYVVIQSTQSWCLLRFPHFRFRPSHNDVFHFDLWYKNENILCDSGTYSYHPTSEEASIDLSSINYHNTVSFDQSEQMPKISRFLLCKWIKPDFISNIIINSDDQQVWNGSCHDAKGNKHERKIEVYDNNYTIYDTLSGPFQKATLGFNLSQQDCILDNGTLITDFGMIRFPDKADVLLIDSISSDYYMEKHKIKRLSLIVKETGIYITQIICNK